MAFGQRSLEENRSAMQMYTYLISWRGEKVPKRANLSYPRLLFSHKMSSNSVTQIFLSSANNASFKFSFEYYNDSPSRQNMVIILINCENRYHHTAGVSSMKNVSGESNRLPQSIQFPTHILLTLKNFFNCSRATSKKKNENAKIKK